MKNGEDHGRVPPIASHHQMRGERRTRSRTTPWRLRRAPIGSQQIAGTIDDAEENRDRAQSEISREKPANASGIGPLPTAVKNGQVRRVYQAILASHPCTFGSGLLVGERVACPAGDVVIFVKLAHGIHGWCAAGSYFMTLIALKAAIEDGSVKLVPPSLQTFTQYMANAHTPAQQKRPLAPSRQCPAK